MSRQPSKRRARASSAKPHRSQRYRRWFAYLLLALIPLTVAGGMGLIYLDKQVVQKFEGKRWAIPAKVYARPLEMYAGQRLDKEQLEWELAGLAYRAIRMGEPGPGEYRWKGTTLAIQTRGFEFWDGVEPPHRAEIKLAGRQIAEVELTGNDSGLLRLEPKLIGGIYPAHNEDRILVTLPQVPQQLIDALIATEDRDFYEHFGMSPRGILRAMVANVKAGGMRQGGSTLTQQLVKNFYLTDERTLTRKLVEAVMAILLERHASKDQILEAYLNEVYLGQAGAKAIHGLGLASLFYFGQPLSELKLDQLALLVGIIRGPSYYDPRRHPERATDRRNQVLALMLEQGMVSEETYAAAIQRPLGVSTKPLYEDNRYPAFMNLVQRHLKREYDDDDLQSEGLRIFTTLDPWVQEQLERSLAKRLNDIQKGYPRAPALEGAGVVTSTVTGEVVALLGGRDPKFQGFNRATDIVRPIGSLIKPPVYLAAIEKGYPLARRIDDIPFSLSLPNGQTWSPSNYDRQSHGSVSLLEALSNSYNLATAKLALDVGIGEVASVLKRLGVDKPIPQVPSLSLGVLELAPLEVASMYQTIAAQGFNTPLRAIRSVLNSDGTPLQRYPMDVDQRFDSADTYVLTRAMQQTFLSGTARAYAGRFNNLQLAGKTGTTNDQRDSWFAGFSGNYLGVVWVGNDENKPTPLTGASGALAVWADMFSRVSLEPLQPIQPDNVRWEYFSATGDALTDAECEGALYLPARIDTLPGERVTCGLIDKATDWFDQLFPGE